MNKLDLRFKGLFHLQLEILTYFLYRLHLSRYKFLLNICVLEDVGEGQLHMMQNILFYVLKNINQRISEPIQRRGEDSLEAGVPDDA